MLILLIGTGVFFTIKTRFFQIRGFTFWFNKTLNQIIKPKTETKKSDTSISPFQAMTTALAASLGTGNIAGVATAVVIGGPGAVFWMWISGFLGMITSFAENALGIYYRKKSGTGEWCGGAMYIIQGGLSNHKLLKPLSKPLAILFACFCTLASFGMGNMVQINTISKTMESTFSLPPVLTGISVAMILGLIIFGGVKRIGATTEKLVPIMALLYIIGALIVVFKNINSLLPTLISIFKSAFGFSAFSGGVSGAIIRKAASEGFKRGVFSNEAGLGSSVLVHCASDITEPAELGMWGMFEVFFDTVVMCTVTALVILIPDTTGATGATLVAKACAENGFGMYGSAFIAISILFFAFSTCLGWSYYGAKCVEYLFGERSVTLYKVIFIGAIFIGAITEMKTVWNIADIFNGLMAIPNLIGVLTQHKLVTHILNDYIKRKTDAS